MTLTVAADGVELSLKAGAAFGLLISGNSDVGDGVHGVPFCVVCCVSCHREYEVG